MGTVANLLSGTPTIYRAPTGEALPELNDLTPPALTIGTPGGNWTAVGFTMEEHEFEYTPTTEAVRVNEHHGPVKMVLTDEDGMLRFKLAENDLTAWSQGMNASTLSTTTAAADQVGQDLLGAGDGSLTEYAYILVGTSPELGSRVIHIPKGVESGASTFTFSKSHNPADVEITIINDTTQTAGERLFKIYDVTAAATT